jgi:hypothetical protein
MQNELTEKFLASLLAFTGAFTTVFLLSGPVTDPVNAPKMVALGTLSIASIATLLSSKLHTLLKAHKPLVFSILIFIFSMAVSSAMSSAPFTQILYGSYGRNTGLLTYLFLCLTLVSALGLNSSRGFQSIVNGLMVAGLLNLLYGLWVILFGDFVAWENPYKSILGTLGNPNFIGAFLGIIFSATLAFTLNQKSSKLIRLLSLLALPVCAFEILDSNAIQGRAVASFGSAIVIFLYLRSRFDKWVVLGYSSAVGITGAFALAGALQVGPLTEFVYKTSVSLRGQYWLAGWNTGKSHPIFGVGMDSFGDWYRRMRGAHALEVPGVNTVVNAAHNVPLDIFAFGGWPLFISYLLILSFSGLAILRVIKRQKDFDLTWTVLVSAWAGYQLQSIISINQIGLAVWGWLLSGAVIAYERVNRGNSSEQMANVKIPVKFKQVIPPQIPMFALIGALIGLLISLPALSSDAKWRTSTNARTLPSLEETMKVSYFNPPNSMKYLQNIQVLEQSGLYDLSRKYALEAVDWNPDNFDFWKALYYIRNSTGAEKTLALQNMKRLDPLNPDVTK